MSDQQKSRTLPDPGEKTHSAPSTPLRSSHFQQNNRKLSLQDLNEQKEDQQRRKGSCTILAKEPSDPQIARRFSVLNPFQRKPSLESSPPELNEYEVVESAFYIPPDFDKKSSQKLHAQQLKDFFSKQPVVPFDVDAACDERVIDTEEEWKSPESWGVLPPPKEPTERALLVENPEWEDLWIIRVFRPEVRRVSRDASASPLSNYPVLDNAGLMFVTVSAPLDTIVSDLYPTLARKFFFCSDLGRYRLFVEHSGLETMLPDESHPFSLQKKWFEEIGYQGRSEINKAIAHEHSYVCRFSLKEIPAGGRGINLNGGFKEELLTKKYALLGNMNLSVVPVDLFMYSATLETIDFSRNTLLSLPDDLFKKLVNLKLLILRQNLLESIPSALLCSPTISNLDLSSNRLSGEALRLLEKLLNLQNLNLTCNRISSLPEELPYGLKSLILSSNYLTQFDPVLLRCKELRELDLSFNVISNVPPEISLLTELQCLVLTGNSLKSISSQIKECRKLRSLDLRGNLLESLDCLHQQEELLELRADYNHLSTLDNPRWPKMVELCISRNNLCQVSLQTAMPYLRILDFSANRIGMLSDDFFSYCPALEYLNLSDNQLTSVPSSLESLSKLVKLVVSNNQLAEFGVDFRKLCRLKILDLHGNNLKRLGPEVWLAPSLAIINLSSNFFPALPPIPTSGDVLLFRNLEELYLGENQCRNEIFNQLNNCRELRKLNLSLNDIYDIPGGFSNYSKLAELYLSHNQLSSLPDDIDCLVNLNILCVNNNRLTSIPGELCKCSNLKILDTSSNALKYNVTNVPFDWNWRWNSELSMLTLSDNPKLDISGVHELTSFKGLKLKSLNLTNVKVRPEAIPDESTTLRVRTSWSDHAGFRVGVSEWCGKRLKFDSFDFTLGKFRQDEDCVIGVFDGKGSGSVSNYLYTYFASLLNEALTRGLSVEDGLRSAFLGSNADLSTQPTELRTGSTLTALYMTTSSSSEQTNQLYVANVGDTVAVLSREGKALELTSRHHAWDRTEMDRLRALGGHIGMNGRVEGGEVELTRAIGYLHMLPYITPSPSIRKIELTEQDEFVIVGSGSLWKVLSYQTAVDMVRKESFDLAIAAQRIRDLALGYGVEDSVIVLVVALKQQRSSDQSIDPSLTTRRRLREDIQDSTLARLPKEIDPPLGPSAMVFTDIKDSTVLWETYTAPMRVAKKMHHMIMRRLLRNIGGYEVKTEGDAFMVAFPSAVVAVRWCLAVQVALLEADWPQELLRSPICASISDSGEGGSAGDVHPTQFSQEQGQESRRSQSLLYRGLSVRMGGHWGEMEGEEDMVTGRMDYNGVPVIIASRVQSLAKGGQILISQALKHQLDLSSAQSTLNCTFIDVGWVRLKGIGEREHVYAVYPEKLGRRFSGPPEGASPN